MAARIAKPPRQDAARTLRIETPRWMLPLLGKARYKGAWGGRGCCHPDTPIDTPSGQIRIADFMGGAVYAWHEGHIVTALATPSVAYDEQQLYAVKLEDGRTISVTDQHRFLTQRGWVRCADLSTSDALVCGPRLTFAYHLQTNQDTGLLALPSDARHSTGKYASSQGCCSACRHRCGQRLLSGANNDQDFVQPLGDAPQHSRHTSMLLDGLECENKNTLSLPSHLQSSQPVALESAGRSFEAAGNHICDIISEQLSVSSQGLQQSHGKSSRQTPYEGPNERVQDSYTLKNLDETQQITSNRLGDALPGTGPFGFLCCNHDRTNLVPVKSICNHDRQIYWDLHVPGFENYLSNGIVNHNSGKSHAFAEALVEAHVLDANRSTVCVREIQKSLGQSVKRLLENKIEALGVSHYFEIQESVIKSRKGAGKIIFAGMQNHTADSIKSLEGYDCAWVEEAQSLSQRSLDLLRPTIRLPGSELWFSWNPSQSTDPVDALLRGDTPPHDAAVVRVNYSDNPWFPDVLKAELEYDKRRDPDKYAHVWRGEYLRNSESRVFRNWQIEEFDAPADAVHRFGADWGFAVDPTTLVRCHVVGRKLFIDYEVYSVGCEIVDTPALFLTIPESERWPIVADSARPETISHMRKSGFGKIMPAVKGAKSVEEGVEFLKSHDIIVHPRCTHTIDELTLYSYKTDPLTGRILPQLQDKKNHVIDALRYACEAIRRVSAARPPVKIIPAPIAHKW